MPPSASDAEAILLSEYSDYAFAAENPRVLAANRKYNAARDRVAEKLKSCADPLDRLREAGERLDVTTSLYQAYPAWRKIDHCRSELVVAEQVLLNAHDACMAAHQDLSRKVGVISSPAAYVRRDGVGSYHSSSAELLVANEERLIADRRRIIDSMRHSYSLLSRRLQHKLHHEINATISMNTPGEADSQIREMIRAAQPSEGLKRYLLPNYTFVDNRVSQDMRDKLSTYLGVWSGKLMVGELSILPKPVNERAREIRQLLRYTSVLVGQAETALTEEERSKLAKRYSEVREGLVQQKLYLLCAHQAARVAHHELADALAHSPADIRLRSGSGVNPADVRSGRVVLAEDAKRFHADHEQLKDSLVASFLQLPVAARRAFGKVGELIEGLAQEQEQERAQRLSHAAEPLFDQPGHPSAALQAGLTEVPQLSSEYPSQRARTSSAPPALAYRHQIQPAVAQPPGGDPLSQRERASSAPPVLRVPPRRADSPRRGASVTPAAGPNPPEKKRRHSL